RPLVERSSGASLEPLAEPENGHELVVVLLRDSEIRNADPDVVDESRSRQHAPPAALNGRGDRTPRATGWTNRREQASSVAPLGSGRGWRRPGWRMALVQRPVSCTTRA